MGQLAELVEAPIVGTWGWEVKLDRCYADPITSTYFGMQPEEGRNGQPIQRFLDAIHADDQERIEWAVAKAVHEGNPFRESYRVVTLGGDVRRIVATGMCFRDAAGEPDLYPGHIIDLGASPVTGIDELGAFIATARQQARGDDMTLLRHLLGMAELEFLNLATRRSEARRRGGRKV